MHDAVKALREPGRVGALAIPIPFFRSRFLLGARIKGMGTLMDKTPGDPNDPIEQPRGRDRLALATLYSNSTATGSGDWWRKPWEFVSLDGRRIRAVARSYLDRSRPSREVKV
jgi:hypothetical protein